MKVSLNLAETSKDAVKWASMAIGVVAALFVVGLAGVLWHSHSMTGALNGLTVHLDAQQKEHEQLSASMSEMPTAAMLSGMVDFAKDTHILFTGVRVSFSTFLSKIEHDLPHDAYLQELAFDRVSGQVSFSVESANEDALTLFFSKLERDPSYKDVKLVRRSAVKVGKVEGGRFQIQMVLVEG